MNRKNDSFLKDTTWRTFLGTLIETPRQKRSVADALGVNPMTLTRWVKNEASPRPQHLQRLLAHFPDHRKTLLPLLQQEFPDLQSALLEEETSVEIPSSFYATVLHMFASSQNLTSLYTYVLQHALDQIDPRHQSVSLVMSHCVPPSPGKKVRSLRMVIGKGITAWGGNVEQQTIFLGAETIPGQVITSGHPITIDDFQSTWLLTAGAKEGTTIGSSATYLLQHGKAVAGTLGALSTRAAFFSSSQQQLLQQYSDLLSSLIPFSEFHTLQDIELGLMPPAPIQLPYLATFRQRVNQAAREAASKQQPLTLIQAETMVWQQLEEELLQVASKPSPHQLDYFA